MSCSTAAALRRYNSLFRPATLLWAAGPALQPGFDHRPLDHHAVEGVYHFVLIG